MPQPKNADYASMLAVEIPFFLDGIRTIGADEPNKSLHWIFTTLRYVNPVGPKRWRRRRAREPGIDLGIIGPRRV